MVPLLTKVTSQKSEGTALKLRGDILAGTDEHTIVIISPKEFHSGWKELVATLDKRAQTQTVTYNPSNFTAAQVAKVVQDTIGTPTRAEASAASSQVKFGQFGLWRIERIRRTSCVE